MCADISVVVPVYNSAATVRELYARLTRTLNGLGGRYEIIFVDDGSIDGSFAEICGLHDTDRKVKAIRLKRNYGQQNALMCGLNHAGGEVVVTIDDDLQNPPEEMGKLIDALGGGRHAVYGIPGRRARTPVRNMGARARDGLFGLLMGKPRGIQLSSFRVMDRWLVERVVRDKTTFVYISAIILKHTKDLGNVAVRHDGRALGRSNYSLFKLTALFFKLFINYSPLTSPWADTSGAQFEIGEKRL